MGVLSSPLLVSDHAPSISLQDPPVAIPTVDLPTPAAMPSPDLPAEIIFEILKHLEPDSPVYSRSCLEVVKFRLLNRQWNLCVVHWLKTTCGGQKICLRAKKIADKYCPEECRRNKRTAAAFHWHKDSLRSHHLNAFKLERLKYFPAFAMLEIKIFENDHKETLTGPELEEVIRCLNFPTVKTAIVRIEATEIAAPRNLFKSFLSQKLAEKLVKLEWMVKGMSDDKIAIFRSFLSQCKNLKELTVEVRKHSLAHFLKMAANLCDGGTVPSQEYTLLRDRFYFEQFLTKVTQIQVKLFAELLTSVTTADNWMRIGLPQGFLTNSAINHVLRKHGFAETPDDGTFCQLNFRKILDNKRIVDVNNGFIENYTLEEKILMHCKKIESIQYADSGEVFVTVSGVNAKALYIKEAVQLVYGTYCAVHVKTL